MHGRLSIILLALLAGCHDFQNGATTNDRGGCEDCDSTGTRAVAFDATKTGAIRGRVLWAGAIPTCETTVATRVAYNLNLYRNPVSYDTPHAPKVHRENHGVRDAVVYLRDVDPRRARPWHHDVVRVDFRDRRLLIQQGAQPTNVGFVRRGDKLSTVNHDAEYHALRGRGAAFFTLPLVTHQPAEMPLKQSGVVELFDAAGYYWVHAHLFVDEHPYYARTDGVGNFTLEQVPQGKYEIVCWMPSWKVVRKDRDPETMIHARMAWAPPVEHQQTVEVKSGETGVIEFRWSQAMFGE